MLLELLDCLCSLVKAFCLLGSKLLSKLLSFNFPLLLRRGLLRARWLVPLRRRGRIRSPPARYNR